MNNRLYKDLAEWWPLLSPPEEYVDEVDFFRPIILAHALPEAPSLLELGSGGGNIASYLKADFAHTTLTDISPEMIAVSRALNPDCEHVVGDMKTLRLPKTYNVVFVHDAIDYMVNLTELRQAITTASVHCKPGGLALFVPDAVLESFQEETESGGSDGQDRAIRYLEWTYDPDKTDMTYTVDYAYLLREGTETRVEYDRHICGLFPRDTWLDLLREAGFKAEIVHDQYSRDVFIARKPV